MGRGKPMMRVSGYSSFPSVSGVNVKDSVPPFSGDLSVTDVITAVPAMPPMMPAVNASPVFLWSILIICPPRSSFNESGLLISSGVKRQIFIHRLYHYLRLFTITEYLPRILKLLRFVVYCICRWMNGGSMNKIKTDAILFAAFVFAASVSAAEKTAVMSGVISADGKTVTVKEKSVESVKPGQSVVVVLNGGSMTVTGTVLEKTGDSSNPDQSNFTGMNAAALASGGTLVLENVQINTRAEGANAVFSTGKNSLITVKGIKIRTAGNSSRGLDATYGGTIHASDADITTEGAHCAALATDRGEGTVTVNGGTVSTSGDGSPVIYSTGTISASNLKGKASGSEIAVIEGTNSITLDGCSLQGAGLQGIMLYQSFSGDAGEGTSVFTAKNSSFTSSSSGPFFYVTNTDAAADVSSCTFVYPSGILVKVAGNDGSRRWGEQGSNGGTFRISAHDQKLDGDIVCDSISSMDFVLASGAVYTGAVNSARQGAVSVTIEKNAVWNVTGDAYLSSLKDTDITYANINSSGHTVFYDEGDSSNSVLAGKTIALPGGGRLVPYKADHAAPAVRTGMRGNMQGGPAGNGGPGDMKDAPDGMQNGPDSMKGGPGNKERPDR